MFNRAWNSPGRRTRRLFKKPPQLDPNRTYLRTDAKTVLAFFAYATSRFRKKLSGRHSLVAFGDSGSFSGLRFNDAELELEEVSDPKGGKAVLVAHLKGSLAYPEGSRLRSQEPIKLTKHEIQNMTDGYPPLYREVFQVGPSAPAIPYPIENLRDAYVRGAWIIATGIAADTGMAMPIYFDPLPSGSHDSVDPCSGFGEPNSPLTRVIQTLELINSAFSASANDQKNIQAVITAISGMHRSGTNSRKFRLLKGTDLANEVPITLSAQQCNFVLGLFKKNVTEKSILSITDKTQLEPILIQVLWAAFWGTHTVVESYKSNYNRVRIPDLLKKHDVVYLRGCDDD